VPVSRLAGPRRMVSQLSGGAHLDAGCRGRKHRAGRGLPSGNPRPGFAAPGDGDRSIHGIGAARQNALTDVSAGHECLHRDQPATRRPLSCSKSFASGGAIRDGGWAGECPTPEHRTLPKRRGVQGGPRAALPTSNTRRSGAAIKASRATAWVTQLPITTGKPRSRQRGRVRLRLSRLQDDVLGGRTNRGLHEQQGPRPGFGHRPCAKRRAATGVALTRGKFLLCLDLSDPAGRSIFTARGWL